MKHLAYHYLALCDMADGLCLGQLPYSVPGHLGNIVPTVSFLSVWNIQCLLGRRSTTSATLLALFCVVCF
jgi:hypothetical protein